MFADYRVFCYAGNVSNAIVELKAKTMEAVTLRMAGDANAADEGKQSLPNCFYFTQLRSVSARYLKLSV